MIDIKKFAPPVTRNIIFLNLIIWLTQVVFESRLGINLADYAGLHYIEADKFNIIQLISYMFLHSSSSFEHVFFNMFSLWFLGSVIEQFWGNKRYLTFYIICGISAALVQEAVWAWELHHIATLPANELINLNGSELITASNLLNLPITVGASGAVFGILLAYGMLFPNSELFLLFIPIPIKAKYFVVGYAVIELFYGVSSTGSNIAHFAHLGGMLGGLILILLWRKKGEIRGPYN